MTSVRSLVLLMLALSVGCTSSADQHKGQMSPELGVGSLVLMLGETATTEDGSFSLRFLEIGEDSRCPQGAQCIWAGNARVVLELSEKGETRQAELNSFSEPRQLSTGAWVVSFGDLEPHPKIGVRVDSADYRLTLDIESTQTAGR